MPSTPKKVLIVEDNESIRQMYQTKLTTEGFTVKTAGDAETGYETAKIFQPDVILLDIMMPNVTGIDFMTYLRRFKENDHIKIIVLTNLDDPALRHSLQAVISDYIVKAETTPGEIADKIRKLVGEPA